MALIFTPLATDTFHRANENPLNPANWSAFSVFPALQVVSNQCVATGTIPTDTGNVSVEKYTGVVFPNNQYISITVGAFENAISSAIHGDLRIAAADSTFMSLFIGSNGDGTAFYQLMDEPTETELASITLPNPVPGDVLIFGVLGSTFFLLKNGVQILSLVDTLGINSGQLATGVSLGTTTSGNAISSFSAGSVSGFIGGVSKGNTRIATDRTSIQGNTNNARMGAIKFGPRIN